MPNPQRQGLSRWPSPRRVRPPRPEPPLRAILRIRMHDTRRGAARMAKFFINRPIVALVISILMVIVGIVAMVQLPIAQYPNIAPPEILLTATYPGADALTLEQAVATPIEQQMSGVDNMIYMYSTSQTSGSRMQLRVDFDITTDPSYDQVLTNLRYSQAASQLPPDVVNQG